MDNLSAQLLIRGFVKAEVKALKLSRVKERMPYVILFRQSTNLITISWLSFFLSRGNPLT
jgi:hypothetical protein